VRERAQAALAKDPAFGAVDRKLGKCLNTSKTQTRKDVNRE